MTSGLVKGSPEALAAGKKAAETRLKNKQCDRVIEVCNTTEKQKFREYLVKLMLDNDIRYGNILSLETSAYNFNKMIDAHHVHYQRDEHEYNRMINNIPPDTEVILGDVKEFTKNNELPIHGVWLDTMQSFDVQKELIRDIVRSLGVDCNCTVFAFTVNTRTAASTKFSRAVQIDRILTECKSIFDEKWNQEPLIAYKEHSTMYNFIFTRVYVNRERKYRPYNNKLGADMRDRDYYRDSESDIYERATGIRYYDMEWNSEDGYGENRYHNDYLGNTQILTALYSNECISRSDFDGILSHASFLRFVSKYDGKILKPYKDKTRCECCGQTIPRHLRKYARIEYDKDLIDIFGWDIFNRQ